MPNPLPKRGRVPGFDMSNAHRLKISQSNILSYLIAHAEGRREMSATQVQASIALLRKVLPDLAALDISAVLNAKHDLPEYSRDELLAILRNARNGGPGTDPPSGRDSGSDQLH
jgi:hypothetical protein